MLMEVCYPGDHYHRMWLETRRRERGPSRPPGRAPSRPPSFARHWTRLGDEVKQLAGHVETKRESEEPQEANEVHPRACKGTLTTPGPETMGDNLCKRHVMKIQMEGEQTNLNCTRTNLNCSLHHFNTRGR
jgi:hypothetical protein